MLYIFFVNTLGDELSLLEDVRSVAEQRSRFWINWQQRTVARALFETCDKILEGVSEDTDIDQAQDLVNTPESQRRREQAKQAEAAARQSQ